MKTPRTQQLVNHSRVIYGEAKILAGPHEWTVGGVTFSTVVVRTTDDANAGKDVRSVIETTTGQRIGRIATRAPKAQGLAMSRAMVDALVAKHGAAIVGNRIAQAMRDLPLTSLETLED